MVDLVISAGSVSNEPRIISSATPQSIDAGESFILTWDCTNVEEAFIEPGIGSVALSGSLTFTPAHTTTYVISATGAAGTANTLVTVSVNGAPAPQPEGSFGSRYNDLIPPDATLASYDIKRFSLITGRVMDLSGDPVPDILVTIFGHPEYGTVKTNDQGDFTIPTEGGSTHTIVYQRDGYLTVHRKVDVPWNDIAIAPDITILSQDSASTTFAFDGNPNTIVTHKSTPVVDESGSRSLTIVFSGDNHAYALDENGNDKYQLQTITTRATEFSTPESMPAVLPPNSAFTYCSELSIDGVERVRFDNPVFIYVENFLGFEVGEIVPLGYYDRDKGVWIATENGMVVRLLDTDNDGVVDAVDTNDDNIADDLNGNRSFIY